MSVEGRKPIKHEVVMRTVSTSDYYIHFASNWTDDVKKDGLYPGESLMMTRRNWDDFGKPWEITVTVAAGDLLNQED